MIIKSYDFENFVKEFKLKKILFTSLLAIVSSSVFAAGNFDGPYVGVHVGYANGDAKGTDYHDDGSGLTGYSFKNNSISSGLIGGFVGFNKTLDKNILVGIDADFEYRNCDKTSL